MDNLGNLSSIRASVPLEIPTKYVLPCKTNGRCRELHFKEYNITIFPSVAYGMNFIEFEPGNFESRVKFRCCTGCYLPVDTAEAARLNDEIGLELPSIDSLRERMAKLRKIRGKK